MAETPKVVPATAKKTEPVQYKSMVIVLTGGDKSQMTVRKGLIAPFRVTVTVGKTINGKRVYQRGATATHVSLAAANAAVEKILKSAAAVGWVKRETGLIPDVFTAETLPKP